MSPHSSPRHELPTAPDPLPIDVVDNHVHLDIGRDGAEPLDVAEAVARARAVGVSRLVQVGCDLEAIGFTIDAVERFPQVLGAIALHPNEVPRLAAAGTLSAAYDAVERAAGHERVRAVGETGLDYFRTGPDGVAVQQDAFRWHIDLAKRLGKVLQIHDRDAHEDVLRVLDEEGAPDRTVLHCFSGDLSMARESVERGYYLSFAGTVTFKNARTLRDALTVTPLIAAARRDRCPVPRHRPLTAVRPTRPTLCHIPFGPWPASSTWTCRPSAGRSPRTPKGSTDPGRNGCRDRCPQPLHGVMGHAQERYRNLTIEDLIIQSG